MYIRILTWIILSLSLFRRTYYVLSYKSTILITIINSSNRIFFQRIRTHDSMAEKRSRAINTVPSCSSWWRLMNTFLSFFSESAKIVAESIEIFMRSFMKFMDREKKFTNRLIQFRRFLEIVEDFFFFFFFDR